MTRYAFRMAGARRWFRIEMVGDALALQGNVSTPDAIFLLEAAKHTLLARASAVKEPTPEKKEPSQDTSVNVRAPGFNIRRL